MKTTVDLPEEVLRKAKIAAVERKTTLKELICKSLLREIDAPADSESPFGLARGKNTGLLASLDEIHIDGPVLKFNRDDAQRKLRAAGN